MQKNFKNKTGKTDVWPSSCVYRTVDVCISLFPGVRNSLGEIRNVSMYVYAAYSQSFSCPTFVYGATAY